MNPCEKAWRAAVDASHVLTRVEARLVAAGALTELRQLHGLSAQEQDVLVHREVHEPFVSTGDVAMSPQTDETVAA